MAIDLEQFKITPEEIQQKLTPEKLREFRLPTPPTPEPQNETWDILKSGLKAGVKTAFPFLEFGKQIPELVKGPVKAAYGALYEAPYTALKGKAPEGEVPVLGGKGFVKGAEEMAGEIIEGREPLYKALIPFAEVPLAGMEVLGAFEASKLLKPLLESSGIVFKEIGKKMYKVALPLTEKEAIMVQAYKAGVPFLQRIKTAFTGIPGAITEPRITAITAAEKGIAGTETIMGIQGKRAATNLWNNGINPALEKSSVKVNMSKFFEFLKESVRKGEQELGRRTALMEAIDSLAESYKKASSVSLSKLQQYKEGWAKFVPERVYKGKPIAGAYNEAKNLAADRVREIIYEYLPEGTKQMYLDYGNLINLQKLGQKAMTGPTIKAFGGIWHAIADKTLTPFMSVGGKVLYRTGEGLEFIGNKGMKKIADILEQTL